MSKRSFRSKTYNFEEVLELVHIDLCGKICRESYNGDIYFIMLFDEYSRMMTIMFLKHKFDAFQKLKWYLARFEKEKEENLKCLRLYRGGESISNEFDELCNESGIKRQVSTPRAPQQNDIIE